MVRVENAGFILFSQRGTSQWNINKSSHKHAVNSALKNPSVTGARRENDREKRQGHKDNAINRRVQLRQRHRKPFR